MASLRAPVWFALCAAVAAAGACEDAAKSTRDGCCDDAAAPVFLASKIDDDEDDDIADHAWMRDDAGVYHLYFQNEGLFGPAEIEHYTSTDLTSLSPAGVALRPRPGTWDQDGVWAPHVIREGGTYYMFYTGVEGIGPDRKERIGLAASEDLIAWERVPGTCPGVTGDGCVYECRESWTTWGGVEGMDNQQCRDPFVMWDAVSGRWLLFATTRSVNGFGTVTVARSFELAEWSGIGFIDATRRLANGVGAQTTGGMAENPFVLSRHGTHYLFFTDWRDPEDSLSVVHPPRTIAQYATSPTLGADTLGSANWVHRGYFTEPGVNAIEVQRVRCGFGEEMWLASFSIAYPTSGLFPGHRRELRLKCIRWRADGTFETANPRLQLSGAALPPYRRSRDVTHFPPPSYRRLTLSGPGAIVRVPVAGPEG